MPEEVLPDLRVPEGFQVGLGAVDAAPGFVDAEDGDGLVLQTISRGEAFAKVGVETLGAEGYEDVYWVVSACGPNSNFCSTELGL